MVLFGFWQSVQFGKAGRHWSWGMVPATHDCVERVIVLYFSLRIFLAISQCSQSVGWMVTLRGNKRVACMGRWVHVCVSGGLHRIAVDAIEDAW